MKFTRNKTLSGLAHGLSRVVSASDSTSYIDPTVSVFIWDGFSFGPGFNLLFEIAQMKTDSFRPSGHDKVLFDKSLNAHVGTHSKTTSSGSKSKTNVVRTNEAVCFQKRKGERHFQVQILLKLRADS